MASEIYRSELAILKLGHAVWDPNPNGEYERVRVGDVGYFEDGAFIVLFNVLPATESQSQSKWGFPEDFKPLVLPGRAVREKSPLVPGPYHSESVQEVSASASMTR
ncbi:hypothetical protein JAAARDRAFT_135705 [Jaapia argillacea MUCL 33604]|uniref:Uncharacterized protein n=1 Tax=Jaapia argillacea MUCL 33604 TaxID=933084 RepID=A0A067PVF3_9AGAM|nr:hypothetical protein JAAARDRAFT_135705 [Jaapia argillacea MUCL 33604]